MPAMMRGTSRAVACALTGLLLLFTSAGPAPAESGQARPAVVLELFTSQGCSSCPSADWVLSRLGGEQRPGGPRLVPLAFHVDYWNRIGWVDPFSSPRWSARQRRYAGVFGLRSVYTPQVVVNGSAELVGSHEGRLRDAIAAAVPEHPAGRVRIAGVSLESGSRELVVDLAAELVGPAAGSRTVANLALFESGLVTRVASGENARRTLENDYVVRLLRPAIVFEAGQSAGRERVRIALAPEWVVGNLGLAVFLQDTKSLEIHAASVLESVAPGRSRDDRGTSGAD